MSNKIEAILKLSAMKAVRFSVVYKILLIILLLLGQISLAQRNNVWVFGDSAKILFNNQSLSVRSNARAPEGSASISDTLGTLLLYIQNVLGGNILGNVYNGKGQILINGLNIENVSLSHSNLFLPFPNHDSLYYLFTLFQFPFNNENGVYYSVINALKDTVGEVLNKNIVIMDSVYPGNILMAVKHGNGRDWWVFWRLFDRVNYVQQNNTFYSVLLTPNGISNLQFQNIGDTSFVGSYGGMNFNKEGNKMAYCDGVGLLEVFDFDRCTGVLSNPTVIKHSCYPSCIQNLQLDVEFSANSRFLYVCDWGDTSYINQYDLQAASIYASKKIVDTFFTYPSYEIPGSVKRWLDNKIYISIADSTASHHPYFLNNAYTTTNTHLAVINNPDLPFPLCNYSKTGLYLNGARTYGALPNNPDYDLGALVGSPCDTLATGLQLHNNATTNDWLIYPNPANDFIYVFNTGQPVFGNYQFTLTNVNAQVIYQRETTNPNELQTIATQNLPNGIYVLQITGENKMQSKKVVILR